jgi:hypothetical protein
MVVRGIYPATKVQAVGISRIGMSGARFDWLNWHNIIMHLFRLSATYKVNSVILFDYSIMYLEAGKPESQRFLMIGNYLGIPAKDHTLDAFQMCLAYKAKHPQK